MTQTRFAGSARGVLAALLWLCHAADPVAAQTADRASDPAPYLHTHPKAVAKPKPKKPKPAHVQVIAPRAPLKPRRSAHHPVPKPVVPEPARPVVAKKPPPPPGPPNVGTKTGLPLPRYAALKSDDVNMRAGPGEQYPVLWTYQRRDLPVKIEREFDIWRLVEDMDGEKGWMQAGFLAGHRSFVITGDQDRMLRAEAADTADAVADLKPGVVGRIRACDAGSDWCQVQVQDYRGWLKRADFWGVDPGEAITP